MQISLSRWIAALALIALLSIYALGQLDTGQIAGIVTDPSGAVIANAVVKLHNLSTGMDRSATASSSGDYVVAALPPGSYEMTVSAPGFAEYRQPVEVTVGARLTTDIKLVLQTATQTVQVEAVAGAVEVNTQDAQISSVITPQQILSLPSLTRNPYDFVSLSGNIGEDPNGSTSANGLGISLNGQRSASTDITLDGAENVNLYDTTPGQQIPLDSVQEYRVVTSGFDANYGRASGGVVNLETKSGTNRFHGSLYEYNRTSTFASNTYFEDATDYFDKANGIAPPAKDHFVRNQFGYSLGGPIMKNKLFFFSNTEWTRIRSTGLQDNVIATPAFLASSAAQTQAFFSQFGTLRSNATLGSTITPSGWVGNAVCGPTCAPLQQVSYSIQTDDGAGYPQNGYSTLNRIDFTLSDKTTINGRYGLYSHNVFAGSNAWSPYAGYDTGWTDFNQNLLLSLTHSFRQNFLTSTKIAYNRLNNEQPLASAAPGPTLYLNENNVPSVDSSTGLDIAFPGYLPFSPGSAIPFGGPQNLYQFSEDLTWNKGKHSVQFGGGYILVRDNRLFGAYQNAVEVASKNGTDEATALVDVQTGTAFQFLGAINPQGKFPCARDYSTGALIQTPGCTVSLPVSSPSFKRNNIYNDGNFYVQDTWRVTPRLTFTPGLRWEYYGVQHNANPNLESNFFLGSGSGLPQQIANGQVLLTPQSPVGGLYQKHPHNFAPRIGLAWDPRGDGKTSIRAGYGIAYERDFGNVTYNVIQNPPNYGVLDIVGTTPITTSNSGPLSGTGTAALPPVSLRAPVQNMPTAYAQFYNASVEHQFLQNTLFSVEYSGSRGEHLYSIANINEDGFGQVFLGDSTNTYNGALGTPLNTQYGAINQRGANGDSYYNALNVRFQVNRFSSQGLQLSANYTYAHTIDDLSSVFSYSGNNFNLGYLDPFNPGLDKGNADYDVRHRLVIGGVYAPKFLEFRNHSQMFRTLVGGWEFAPIFTIRTGTPFTLYDCSNAYISCPDAVATTGLSRTGHAVPNGGIDSFNYIQVPAGAMNPYLDPILGRSDLPTCGANGCMMSIGLQRNSFWSPGYYNWDMGVYKDFKVHERYTVQLRGEFYNIVNHKNMYIVPGLTDFAYIGASGYVPAIKGTPGGSPSASDERRNMQLALRFQF